jgi:hypothetical protein
MKCLPPPWIKSHACRPVNGAGLGGGRWRLHVAPCGANNVVSHAVRATHRSAARSRRVAAAAASAAAHFPSPFYSTLIIFARPNFTQYQLAHPRSLRIYSTAECNAMVRMVGVHGKDCVHCVQVVRVANSQLVMLWGACRLLACTSLISGCVWNVISLPACARACDATMRRLGISLCGAFTSQRQRRSRGRRGSRRPWVALLWRRRQRRSWARLAHPR